MSAGERVRVEAYRAICAAELGCAVRDLDRTYGVDYGPVYSREEIAERLRGVLAERPPADGGIWTAEKLRRACARVDRRAAKRVDSDEIELVLRGRIWPRPDVVAVIARAVGMRLAKLWSTAVTKYGWWWFVVPFHPAWRELGQPDDGGKGANG